MTVATVPTAYDYGYAFNQERQRTYPVVDAFEAEMGFAIDRQRLEDAAAVLACPVKRNPPNWQHGRVLYAAARRYIASQWVVELGVPFTVLDIGTAKGFSALCLVWAVLDAPEMVDNAFTVTTVDVVDPNARVRRNTIAEVGGLRTLAETLADWPEAGAITFLQGSGVEWLNKHSERIHIAFVDGKHTGEVVRKEGEMIALRQEPGDLCVFDDLHIPDLAKAVTSLATYYELRTLEVLPTRKYAIGRRRAC